MNSEKRFRALSEYGPDFIIEMDDRYRITFASANLERTLGVAAESVQGASVRSLLDPEDSLDIESHVRRSLGDGSSRELTVRRSLEGDQARWFHLSVTPCISEGDEKRALIVGRDDSENHEAILRLSESEERHRLMVEQIPEGIIVHARGEILFANKSAARLIGAESAASLIGTSVQDIVDPSSYEVTAAQVDAARVGDVLHPAEWRLRRRDGEIRDVIGTGGLAMYGGQRVILGIMRDVTDLKRSERARELLETQFRQAQKLESLGVLAGGIAHDFNNLLTVILGNTRLVRSRLSDQDPNREVLRDAMDAAEEAAVLTRQILAYAGHRSPSTAPIDLSEDVQSTAELMTLVDARKVDLDLKLETGLPRIDADGAQLRQIVRNLVINAAEALGASQGRVCITTSLRTVTAEETATWLGTPSASPGAYVTLEVSDSGAGIDAATRESMFDPFYTTKALGQGLGLSAVLGAAKGHGGGITVESRLDEGTAVTVFFPALDVQSKGRAGPPAGEEGVRQLRVLVADDEPPMRRFLRRVLERAEYSVSEASDGIEALQRIDTEAIDLVLLDLTMPRKGGEEVLSALRRTNSHLPVLLSSGYDAAGLASRIGNDEHVAFLPKPYTEQQLLHQLGRLLD